MDIKAEHKAEPCPNCGYCPHCGRSAQTYRMVPYCPYPYTPYPVWYGQHTIYGGTLTQATSGQGLATYGNTVTLGNQ